jgi:hypothetical protein
MFHVAALARKRKSLFFKGACRYDAEKRSDNLTPRFVGFPLSFRLTYRYSVVILSAMYPLTVKMHSSNGTINEYVRVVEAFLENGKVKERVVVNLGRKDLLIQMLPKL